MHFVNDLPAAEDFLFLRNSTGWGIITQSQAFVALENSLGGYCAYDNGNLAAMARYIGDGVLNIYLQDVVVAPTFRSKGLGATLMVNMIDDLQYRYPQDCTIGLLAAKDQDAFYTQFGFNTRPSHVYGAGMSASLGDLRKPETKG